MLFLKPIHPRAQLPTKGSVGSSGYDVCSIERVVLEPGVPNLIHTGLQVTYIEPQFEIQVRPRSGNSLKKGFTVANTPGTIDNDYRGEICIILVAFKAQVVIEEGMKIAQLVPMYVDDLHPLWSDTMENTARGSGGFGSTDAKSPSGS